MPQQYVVPRLTDRQVIRALEGIVAVRQPTSLNIALVGGLNTTLEEAKDRLGKNSGFLISSAIATYSNFRVTLSRTKQGDDSSLSDLITVHSGYEVSSQHDADTRPDALDPKLKFDITRQLFDAFSITGVGRQPSSKPDEVKAQLETLHLNILDRLEGAAIQQLLANQRHAEQIDLLIEKRAEKLNADYELQLTELEKQRGELENLRRELDDRDNTHVRRELRRSINTHIQENLRDFSFQYLKSRGVWTLHALYIGLIVFFAALSGFFALRLSEIPFDIGSSLNLNLVVLGVKQTASIAALVFVVSMYIRFLNQNLKRAADFEFMIRNFQLDIERASWTVETALEWRRDQGGQMPDALLVGVTKDLFKRHDHPNESETSAADSLASALLGSAARAQIETPFGKVEYDSKGIKRLEKEKPSS